MLLPATMLAVGFALGSQTYASASTQVDAGASRTKRPEQMAQPFVRRAVGLGPVISDKFGGLIFGWSIDENGSDGLLSEVTPPSGDPFTSVVEAFDQSTGKITKVIARQRSGATGGRELFVDSILANDVGLIDDEHDVNGERDDVFDVMAPVTGNKFTGTWAVPPGNGFLLWGLADQESDPNSVMITTTYPVRNQPPAVQLVVANVPANQLLYQLGPPSGDAINYPYLVAEDVQTKHAYVPGANYQSETVFIDYNTVTGRVSNNFVAPAFSGPVMGMAIDSAKHVMCTTTQQNFSVQFYDIATRKQTLVVQIPNAEGEGQAGSSIAADSIRHLFLVTQPNSLRGGSEIYVYSESGAIVESLAGFDFGEGSGIQVNAATRTGFVPGAEPNQVQSFTY